MPPDESRGVHRYSLLVTLVVLAGIGGYAAYLLYPRFSLPAVDAAGLALLSLTGGVAAFFSPCSFPLLATLLIRETRGSTEAGGPRASLMRALSYSLALSLGAAVFLALTAAVIAAGGQVLVGSVTFLSPAGRIIRTLGGVLLVFFGLVQLGRIRVDFGRIAALARPILHRQAEARRQAPMAGFALFGFAYLVAGFG